MLMFLWLVGAAWSIILIAWVVAVIANVGNDDKWNGMDE